MRRHALQIGDLHLAPGGRQVDRLEALDRAIEYGECIARRDPDENELGVWLIPGDIYHTDSTVEDRNAIKERLKQMARYAPVLIVAGNHDTQGDLDILADLGATHRITVVTRPKFLRINLEGVEACIFCLPYQHRAVYVMADADVHATADADLRALCATASETLAVAKANGDIAFSIGHINVAGSIASTGQPQIGQEIELAPDATAMLSPLFLNHIHKHQVVHGAVYAGSICRLDFGENEPKGFLDITWTNEGDGHHWTHTWEFVELDVPRQLLIAVRITPSGITPETPADAEALLLVPGAYVRLRYRYLKADLPMLDLDSLGHLVISARSYKLEPDPIRDGDVRAPEIIKATTLEDKVKLFCALVGVEWTGALAAKVEEVRRAITS